MPALPAGRKKIEPGQPWDGLAALAARLRAFGDLAGDAPRPDADYDGAARRRREELPAPPRPRADGVLGAGTIATLNVTLAHRVRQIELAMERMRWLPQVSDRPNLFVNVPLFRLWATDPADRRRAAAHERRRRQVARPQDADLHRPHGVRDLPARTGTRRSRSP